MPAGVRSGAGRQITAPERKPDYFIGPSGKPILTSHIGTMHYNQQRSTGGSDAGIWSSKPEKGLHNLAIRNAGRTGATSPTDKCDRGFVDSNRRRNQPESEVMPTIRRTVAVAVTGAAGSRSSTSPPLMSGSTNRRCSDTFDTGRTTAGTAYGWSNTGVCNGSNAKHSSSNRSTQQSAGSFTSGGYGQQPSQSRSTNFPPQRLLSVRSNMQRSSATEGLIPQQCIYPNHNKQLDNRLNYQRSYDRNVFGYNERLDQFVLPPLQI